MMNVNYPKDDTVFINSTFIVCLIFAGISLGYGAWRYGFESFKKLGIILGVFILGIGLSLSPWFIKNIHEIGLNNITISGLLNGQ